MISFVYSIKDSAGCNQISLYLNECGKMQKKWIQINEMLHCIYMPLCLFALLCLTLCDSMDCNLPGTSVHGDSPGKILE